MAARLVLGLAAILMGVIPALAQQGRPSYTADQLTAILSAKAQPAFTADQFQAILKPGSRPLTRSLSAGTGPAAEGAPGSGVIPDLKVQFTSNSAELTAGSKATLDELGKALQSSELRALRFEIAGHTDAKGSDKANEELSRRRAMAVTNHLQTSFGIEARRLQPTGYGEKRLADPQNPNSGANRRVEIRTTN